MKEKKKSGDLVSLERTLSQRIADGKEQIGAIRELTKVALALCRKKSIINQDGQPYIRSDTAAFIGGRFGVQIIDMKWEPREIVAHNDGFPDEIIWTVSGYYEFDGNRFPCAGVSTTRDKFYCRRTDKQGKKYYLSYDEIDLASLKLKAVTRLCGNASRRALDLNSLDWLEVTEATGIKKEDVAGVEYKGGSGKKREITSESQDKLEKIKKMAIYLTQGNAELEGELLLSITANPSKGFNGTNNYDRLSDAQISWVHREYEKRQKKQMEIEANPPGAKP